MPLLLAPETLVTAGPLWTVAVNRNQDLLGKTMLVAHRGVELVTTLRPDEWSDLHRQIAQGAATLEELFTPDQYNHAFLMNADAHVHLHLVLRYRTERRWGGLVFSDPHFGTLFDPEQRALDTAALASLAAAILTHLPQAATGPTATGRARDRMRPTWRSTAP